jgi:hypothetical protein
MSNDKVEFEGASCISQSNKAIRVRLADRVTPIWIPRSLVDDDSEVYERGHTGTLVLPEWWCIQEGLV